MSKFVAVRCKDCGDQSVLELRGFLLDEASTYAKILAQNDCEKCEGDIDTTLWSGPPDAVTHVLERESLGKVSITHLPRAVGGAPT